MLHAEDVATGGAGDAAFDFGAALDLLEVNRLVVLIFAVLEEVIETGDDAHADDVVMQWDIPEPAGFALRLQDDRGAFVPARVAIGPFPIRPQTRFAKRLVPVAESQAAADHGSLAAGIDDDLGTDFVLRAVFAGEFHADGPLPFPQDFEDADPLVHLHAVLAGVVEHHLVEFTAEDLPGLRAFVRLVVVEIKGLRKPAALADELDAVLFYEGAAAHFFEHVEPLEDPICLGDEGFADVKSREVVALEEDDGDTLLGEQRGSRRAGRSAADHNYWNFLRNGRLLRHGKIPVKKRNASRFFGPGPVGGLMRFTDVIEECDQLSQAGGGEMPQLPRMAAADRVVEHLEQFQPPLRQSHLDHAAVGCQPIAADELLLLELVEQAGDVRGTGDEPLGQSQRGEAARMTPPEKAERIVLLGGEADRFRTGGPPRCGGGRTFARDGERPPAPANRSGGRVAGPFWQGRATTCVPI